MRVLAFFVRPPAKKTYKTIKFVVYCYEKSKPGKEEGTSTMTDSRHRLVKSHPKQHFDSYDEIGRSVRRQMGERKNSSPR
jgi:hypothetical protein